MVDVDAYMAFMGIDSFPPFTEECFDLDLNQEHIKAAKAEYDYQTKEQKLHVPSGINIPRFLLYHELTHILDMNNYSTGERNHDYCLTGFTEYHASQVELMVLLGADKVTDRISFSMSDSANYLGWSVKDFVDNKFNIAKDLIISANSAERLDGLGVLYNFLGLRSICIMYSKDYDDKYTYQTFMEKLSTMQIYHLRNTMTGWIEDVEKAVALYSNVVGAVYQ